MKVFLDTNVLVSGFMTRGLSADVIRLVMAEHEFVTAEVVLAELQRILIEKFRVSERKAKDVEALLRRYHVEPKPPALLDVEVRDEDDAWVLASAIASGADVLVTGDRDLLDISTKVEQVRIVTPRGFWNLIRQ